MSIKDYRNELASKVEAARTSGVQSRTTALHLDAPSEPPEDPMLSTLENSTASPEERLRALGGLKVLTFASPNARKFRPRFINALHAAIDYPGLRIAALRTLSALGDASVRELLVSGLREPSTAIIPAADAFALLADDPHQDAIPEARKAVDRASNEPEVTAALQLLARDPGSKRRLRRIVVDVHAPEVHRRAAAESLFALDKRALAKARGAMRKGESVSAFVDSLVGTSKRPRKGRKSTKPATARKSPKGARTSAGPKRSARTPNRRKKD